MKKTINIFGKQIKLNDILYYGIFILIFSIYSFVLKPFINLVYLDTEIEKFEDNYSWKIYLALWLIFILFALYKIEKVKEKIFDLVMILLFSIVFGFIFITKFITNNSLFINQLYTKEKEKFVYTILKEETYISLMGDKGYIDDEKHLQKIDEIRKRNHFNSLEDTKNRDTINAIFNKGIFGFKYLK